MSQHVNLLKAFATTSPGLERVLAEELTQLGAKQVHKGRAGCGFLTDRVTLERVTVSLVTAHRVLWTLGEVDARDADSLYRGVRELVRWQGIVPADKTFAVFATCRDTPAFRDARFAGLRVKDAIVDVVREATGKRPDVSPEDPDVLVRVSIANGRGIVSLDAAGKTSLHARGYRTEAGEAPLRESLAAALPRLAGWDMKSPLVDPMCGSGTILIEAALAARCIAPGTLRNDYGFMRWPGFKPARHEAALESLRARALPKTMGSPSGLLPKTDAPLIGFDIDAELLAVARANAERAGVAADVQLAVGDATSVTEVPEEGLLVTNPPWGARLGDHASTVELLRAVAAHWRGRGRWRAAVLVPDAEAAHALDLLEERIIPLEAGGRDVLLVTGRLA